MIDPVPLVVVDLGLDLRRRDQVAEELLDVPFWYRTLRAVIPGDRPALAVDMAPVVESAS
jgi:hypothetical protein